MNVIRMGAAILLVMALASTGARADQVYRWVDAQGNVHYSQTPPPNAVTKAKRVDIVPQPADITGAKQQQQLVKSMADARQTELQAANAAKQQAEQNAQKQQACEQARKRLQGYMEAHRVITHANSKNPTYYTGDNLVKFRQQAQAEVDKLCGSN
ncbi:MAG: DUF4124 domain-containing protein [Gammaproteobacteria bacterium]|nr:DUF4124 domain-containing protein [Gammaproteobacteria bacterium]MDE2346680.1 DUF4124 domain-containing protein [Gammaproteobacteria bacterium]